MAKVNITSPVGRIVMGSLYEAQTEDAEGKPLVFKSGANVGQPRVNYFFALAIPKQGESHWAHTPWGQQIWNVGHAAFPQAAQAEDFSWKVIDGDSQKPGKLFKGKPGKKPCENEGWPGHWVLRFSGGFAPKVYKQDGTGYVQMMERDFCKPGYYVEVAFSVDGNNSQSQPGVYLNHSMVCFRAYGAEINFGPDVTAAGFGSAPLPAGASLTPPPSAIPMPAAVAPAIPTVPVPAYAPAAAGMPPPPMAASSVPTAPGVASGLPQIPGVPAPLVPAGSVPMPSAPAQVAPAPIPVMPNPAFLQVPPPAAAAPAPMAPPAAPVRQMTAAATTTYEAYIAAGWNDALLVQNGLMLA